MLSLLIEPNFFISFNLVESLLWFAFAVGFCMARRSALMPPKYWYILEILFFFFGLSDIVEAYIYPINFFDQEGYWLLAWKGLCVTGFVICLVWYIWKRGKFR